MLLDNLWIERGLVNNIISTVRDLIWQTTINDTDIPHIFSHIILVKFDKLPNESNISININAHYYIPIFAVT